MTRGHGKRKDLKTTEPSGTRLTGRLWIERDGETFLGWGRVVLLERIREHGSMRQAAKSMEMGYRHAWTLVETMNRLADEPLVLKTTGGPGGGGASLTPAGDAAIAEWWKLTASFGAWLDEQKNNSSK